MAPNGLRAGTGMALGLMLAALTGCGGISDGDKDEFARDADKICKETQTKAARGAQPRTLSALSERVSKSHVTLRAGTRQLHDLRKDLGDSVPDTITTFDSRLDGVVTSTKVLAEDASLEDAGAVRKTAERLRKQSAALYKAAQSAGMKQCGRGGNRAADRALFAAYREEFYVVSDDFNIRGARLGRQFERVNGLGEYLRVFGRTLRAIENFRHRFANLNPPRNIRRTHKAVQRRTTALLRSARRFRRTIRRGPSTLASGEFDVAGNRFGRDADRFDRVERRLRILLNGRKRSSGSRSGGTRRV